MEKSESHIGIWLLAENSITNSYRSMLKNTVHINNKEHHRLFQVHLNYGNALLLYNAGLSRVSDANIHVCIHLTTQRSVRQSYIDPS